MSEIVTAPAAAPCEVEVLNGDEDTVSVFVNAGGRALAPRFDAPPVNGTEILQADPPHGSLALADVTGDGRLDIVTGNSGLDFDQTPGAGVAVIVSQ